MCLAENHALLVPAVVACVHCVIMRVYVNTAQLLADPPIENVGWRHVGKGSLEVWYYKPADAQSPNPCQVRLLTISPSDIWVAGNQQGVLAQPSDEEAPDLGDGPTTTSGERLNGQPAAPPTAAAAANPSPVPPQSSSVPSTSAVPPPSSAPPTSSSAPPTSTSVEPSQGGLTWPAVAGAVNALASTGHAPGLEDARSRSVSGAVRSVGPGPNMPSALLDSASRDAVEACSSSSSSGSFAAPSNGGASSAVPSNGDADAIERARMASARNTRQRLRAVVEHCVHHLARSNREFALYLGVSGDTMQSSQVCAPRGTTLSALQFLLAAFACIKLV